MNLNTNTFPENYLKEDFVAKTDEYVNELDILKKRDLIVKIGLGVVYVTLLIISVIVV